MAARAIFAPIDGPRGRRRRRWRRRLVGHVLDGRGRGLHRQVDRDFRRRHLHRRPFHFWRRRRRRLVVRLHFLDDVRFDRRRDEFDELVGETRLQPHICEDVQANDHHDSNAAAGEETRI
ncbi:MAG: hypothetical protein QM747_13200 [Nocardioides sp.]